MNPREGLDDPGQHGYLPPPVLREPATILARPSAVAMTRLAWAVLTVALCVLAPPAVAQWLPWCLAPLLVSCVLDAGVLSALGWLLATLVMTAVLPPGGDSIAVDVLGGLLVIGATRRFGPFIAASAWAPATVGALVSLVHDAVPIVMDAASSGHLTLGWVTLGVRAIGTGVLTALVVPVWTRWAGRERLRGRA